MAKMILASLSPRRKELLTQIGISFDCIPSDCEEIITTTVPADAVTELATQKADHVAQRIRQMDTYRCMDCVVLGADTVVAQNETILGKPADEAEAFAMLSALQGATHDVYTGVCLHSVFANGEESSTAFFEKTTVEVLPMSREEILSYIATGEPMDKAGAYGIQGVFARHIRRIEGDYYNVVGLPVSRVYAILNGRTFL